jgi:hypothetical protein
MTAHGHACRSWTSGSAARRRSRIEDAIVRSALVTPDASAVVEHRVDRATRADLGLWRVPLDGAHARRIAAGLAGGRRAVRPHVQHGAPLGARWRLAVTACGRRAAGPAGRQRDGKVHRDRADRPRDRRDERRRRRRPRAVRRVPMRDRPPRAGSRRDRPRRWRRPADDGRRPRGVPGDARTADLARRGDRPADAIDSGEGAGAGPDGSARPLGCRPTPPAPRC